MRKIALLLGICVSASVFAQTAEYIKPSDTKVATKFNDPNMIVRPKKMPGAPIFLWLPGTSGKPELSQLLMHTVAEQGYRAIGLEYNDVPAVNQVCPQSTDPDCAAKFREMRVWGTGGGVPDISNSMDESIESRLALLLKELQRRHPKESWEDYLTADGKPVWSKIAVSGQSQGAGMAAFIAKKVEVPRVILFSSPIDSTRGQRNIQLAPWLLWPSATSPERWYAVRNSREPFNAGLIKSYPALGIPVEHIRVFTLDLPPGADTSNPMVYHGTNIRDPRYVPEWRFLFGDVTK
jgi:hypothetical protein